MKTNRIRFSDMTTDALIQAVEIKANSMYDGHYTILSFTTHYKGFFRIPNLDNISNRKEVLRYSTRMPNSYAHK